MIQDKWTTQFNFLRQSIINKEIPTKTNQNRSQLLTKYGSFHLWFKSWIQVAVTSVIPQRLKRQASKYHEILIVYDTFWRWQWSYVVEIWLKKWPQIQHLLKTFNPPSYCRVYRKSRDVHEMCTLDKHYIKYRIFCRGGVAETIRGSVRQNEGQCYHIGQWLFKHI